MQPQLRRPVFSPGTPFYPQLGTWHEQFITFLFGELLLHCLNLSVHIVRIERAAVLCPPLLVQHNYSLRRLWPPEVGCFITHPAREPSWVQPWWTIHSFKHWLVKKRSTRSRWVSSGFACSTAESNAAAKLKGCQEGSAHSRAPISPKAAAESTEDIAWQSAQRAVALNAVNAQPCILRGTAGPREGQAYETWLRKCNEACSFFQSSKPQDTYREGLWGPLPPSLLLVASGSPTSSLAVGYGGTARHLQLV